MAILLVLGVLHVLLILAAISCGRSYFDKGRIAGMKEAVQEIVSGLRLHYETTDKVAPEQVAKAIEVLETLASTPSEKSVQRHHAKLRILGDAIGSACWRKGFVACRQQMLPRQDRIRIDLSLDELTHLASLAHLGFKKMMPNDRAIEMIRFNGEQHAQRVSRAVDRLEIAIPEPNRPSDHSATRQRMIRHWWPLERKSA
jgi:hypothetical protein